jgi:hypothetical protein
VRIASFLQCRHRGFANKIAELSHFEMEVKFAAVLTSVQVEAYDECNMSALFHNKVNNRCAVTYVNAGVSFQAYELRH